MFNFSNTPLPVFGIWKAALNLYRKTILKVWYLFLIPTLVFIFFAALDFMGLKINPIFWEQHQTFSLALLVLSIVLVIFFAIYFSVVSIHRIYSLAHDTGGKLIQSFKISFEKFWLILGNAFVGFLLLLIVFIVAFAAFSLFGHFKSFGLFAGIFILFFLSLFLLFCVPAILLDNYGVFRAIKYSFSLVWRKWWQVLGAFILVLFIGLIFNFLIALILSVVPKEGFIVHLINLLSFVITALLTTPLFIATLLIKYNDLKLHHAVKSGATPQSKK